MFENQFHISQLITGYLRGTLDAKQQHELTDWIHSSDENQSFFLDFLTEENLSTALKEYNSLDEEVLWENTISKIHHYKTPTKYNYWLAAAAMVLVIFSVGLVHYMSTQQVKVNTIAHHNHIQPGKQAATLVLANGQKILINDVSSGNIATQSGVRISKTANGQILYEVMDRKNDKLEYNTLYTANGQQTQIRLPDGSIVFLNAASSLKYPTSFKNLNKREVQLSGEGYFEISKDKSKPFTVRSKGQKIEVLGTHFNINAYIEEAVVKTTLLEGALKINNRAVLKPGQQSVVQDDKIEIREADLEEAVAWKNGYFIFNPENFENTMNMIARWYDVEIVYDYKPVNLHLAASISRNRNLADVLKIIQNTEDVKFKIEGRRIRVIK
ncbi:FecR family protein [Pedobacter sp. AW31-3R]|uniref:FecR family protein n=1 Tax=Pedobacter sp. AW31-3R TaxID=3445781 RepID=UPI003F9FAE1A